MERREPSPPARYALTLVAAAAASLLGCPAPPSSASCEQAGEFGLEFSARNAEDPLTDGAEVSVFPPPQGGIATELDVRIFGIPRDEIATVRVEVTDPQDELLAVEQYLGEGLPLFCDDDEEALLVRAMPVPFAFDLTLEDLDGAEAVVRLRAESMDGERVEEERSVTLRAAVY